MKASRFLICWLVFAGASLFCFDNTAGAATDLPVFPRPTDSYGDQTGSDLWQRLASRAAAEPFNLVATVIFLLAICHTFLASRFLSLAHGYAVRYEALEKLEANTSPAVARQRDQLLFRATLFHLLGEVEAVFGIWAIPLGIAIVAFHGWKTMVHYFDGVEYTEAIFVFVIMAIASSKPILRFAESCLSLFAGIGGKSPAAWWLSILTVGPLLGSFITEPAAMTIGALLLVDRFYRLQPSMTLRYATLGLLFVNISVGGHTHSLCRPSRGYGGQQMGMGICLHVPQFGWKAMIGIPAANLLAFLIFRKELVSMKNDSSIGEERRRPISLFVTTCPPPGNCLDGSQRPLFFIGYFWTFVLSRLRRRDRAAPEFNQPSQSDACWILSGGARDPWRVPAMVDCPGPWRSGQMALDDRIRYSHCLQRQCRDHLSCDPRSRVYRRIEARRRGGRHCGRGPYRDRQCSQPCRPVDSPAAIWRERHSPSVSFPRCFRSHNNHGRGVHLLP